MEAQKDPKVRARLPQVAYQGIQGSYGHEASLRYFGKNADFLPCAQFANALEAVVSGKAEHAVLPLENSTAGVVNQTLDILVDYRCFIHGEVVLPVSHCLLAPEGAVLESIDEVCSHQQALMQCSRFLGRRPDIATRLIDNTAVAARHVGQQRNKRLAAIASRACADLYGLTVLAEDLQDQAENYTRFVIVSANEHSEDNRNKASVRFALPHESGSLAKILLIPAELGISLTSIVSRPYPGKSFQYYFYADMVGESTRQIEDGLRRMAEVALEWTLLGCYASAEKKPTWNFFDPVS